RCSQQSRLGHLGLAPSRLLQPSGQALLGLGMGDSAPFLNRLFTPSDTLQELHSALHQLVAFYVDEVGAGLSVLRNENRLATPLEVIEQFGGLTLQGRDEFGTHAVIL